MLEGFISPHFLVIGVFNVHRGDVVRQKHDLVAMQFAFILFVQRDARDVLHQAHDEIARAHKRIDDVNPGIGQRFAEVGFQEMLDAVYHEIDDGLRRVDDPVSIGILDREVLEEALIERVEKILLLGEIGQGAGGFLDRRVKRVETLEELVSVKGVSREDIDDVLNFAGDDIASGEIGIIEDGSEDAFRHQVLREHPFHLCLGEIRVNRVSALLMEVRERLSEFGGILAFGLNECLQFRAEFGDGILECVDGIIPLGKILLRVGEEGFKELDEIARFRDVQVEDKRAVLVEDGAMRGLEDDVFRGVARGKFLLRFNGEIIEEIFRLPVPEDESEVGDDFAVDADVVSVGCCARLFAYQREIALSAVVLQECLEGDADGTFMLRAEFGELFEFGVVVFYGFVCGFDVEHCFPSVF